MARIAGKTVLTEYRALEIMKIGKPVTPDAIVKHVGKGDYASRYISMLKRKHGFKFSIQKDGRDVISYTLTSEPKNVAAIRAMLSASTAPKKVKIVKAVKKQKTPVIKNILDKEAEALLSDIGLKTAGEYAGGTYSIDPEWDSMTNIDVANFLK